MLVNKLWHDTCYEAALLRQLHIGGSSADSHEDWSTAQLAAFAAWLARRRPLQHAESMALRLRLPTGLYRDLEGEEMRPVAMEEHKQLVACWTAIGSSGSTLRALELSIDRHLLPTGGPWLARLTALTSLSVANPGTGGLYLAHELRRMRGLQQLCVSSDSGVIAADDHLPPCVTRLRFEDGSRHAGLPASVSVSAKELRESTLLFDSHNRRCRSVH